ncbi:MAG: 4Fe-4S dicluster domain-containing protein [Lachnospiraceae bacterium]|nr:4Fe-4S dicluster domain-containing protein [Lachnospiraceae bacterium]
MRGIYSNKTEIRHQVFTEIAKMAYEGGDFSRIEELPYKLVPGEMGTYYNNIFLERAIIGERLRATMGLPIRNFSEHSLLSEGIDKSAIDEKYYDPPLVNIIKFACHACPEKRTFVTNGCQGCLEHPCVEVCPKKAISMVDGHSVIDEEKCIHCGKCVNACPYNAIVKQERPCAKACGMNAIKSDQYGRADIDYNLCVSCGMCLVSCPFSAIVDKSQIFQTVLALKSDTPIYAAIAPSFINQFGEGADEVHMRAALKELGFEDMIEVAIGADLCALQEAEDFLNEVPEKIPFMGTSCCPAWSVMAKQQFPEYANCISMALTPMVLTARMIKKDHPDCKVVFIGPCAAKKLEASRRSVRSEVDFVLTFEEMAGIFSAKGIDPKSINASSELTQKSSADGKGFAVSGGVAHAVTNVIKKLDPDREVKVVSAEGLAECKKMMMLAKAGKYDGYLLEGMACPGGCVGGAGVVSDIKKAAKVLESAKTESALKTSNETEYKNYLDLITSIEEE